MLGLVGRIRTGQREQYVHLARPDEVEFRELICRLDPPLAGDVGAEGVLAGAVDDSLLTVRPLAAM